MDERSEIEQAVGEGLSELGVSGSLVVSEKNIELRTDGGAPIVIDIELSIRQWPLLPAEMRTRKAGEIARRLAEAYRKAGSLGRARPTRRGPPPRFWGAVAAGLGILVLVGVVRMILPRLGTEKAPVTTPSEPDLAKRERLARACDAMRDRLYKGASFGPFATEGWVVELWLAQRKGGSMRDHAALKAVIVNGKLTAAADDALADIKDGAVEIADGFTDEAGARSPAWGGATMVFREGYARAFLEQETRERFVSLAGRLAEATGAEAGALYARCAHLATHDIGAWFHGSDAPGAVASMVYQMGLFAEDKLVDRGAVAAQRAPGGDLDGLRKAAGGPDGNMLPSIAASHGATTNTRYGVAFVFPLSAPMRPIAATRAMARKMGVGVGSE